MTAAVGIAQSGVNNVSWRNRIINGGMVVDQRNAGASVTPNNSYTLDRWLGYNSQTSKFNVQQNSGGITAPSGFSSYLGAVSSSAYSIAAGDYFGVSQAIEGFNTSDLGWGTASAQTVTLSFWVRSSLTGTFSVSIRNYGSYNRGYPATYTINAANTWELKTITIPGDTSGTWTGATNNGSFLVSWSLGTGSTYSGTANAWQAGNIIAATGATSVVGTNGATFYITGVQLERGTTATPFEYRDYGRELMMCQRYYIQINGSAANPAIATGTQVNTTTAVGLVPLPVSMRTTSPTITGGVAVSDTFAYNTGLTTSSASLTSNCLNLSGTMAASGAQGRPIVFLLNGASAYLGIATEL